MVTTARMSAGKAARRWVHRSARLVVGLFALSTFLSAIGAICVSVLALQPHQLKGGAFLSSVFNESITHLLLVAGVGGLLVGVMIVYAIAAPPRTIKQRTALGLTIMLTLVVVMVYATTTGACGAVCPVCVPPCVPTRHSPTRTPIREWHGLARGTCRRHTHHLAPTQSVGARSSPCRAALPLLRS